MRSNDLLRTGLAALTLAWCVSVAGAATNEQIAAGAAARMQTLRAAQESKLEKLLAKIEVKAAKLAAKGVDPARIAAMRVDGMLKAERAIEAARQKLNTLESGAVKKLSARSESDDDIAGVHDAADVLERELETHASSHLSEFEHHMMEHETEAEDHSDGSGSDDQGGNGGGADDPPGHT